MSGRLLHILLFVAISPAVLAACKPDIPINDVTPPVWTPPLDPFFSHDHGLYNEAFDLVLTPQTEGDTIRYTLDGRDPSGPTASDYTGPIPIETTTVIRASVTDAEGLTDNKAARTYVFPEHVAAQQPPEGYPDIWWVGTSRGEVPADYAIDPEVVNDGSAPVPFERTFELLPIVSVVMDPDELFGPDGIHENSSEQGIAWERATSAEMFTDDLTVDWAQNCAIRLQGGSSRRSDRTAKKSFRLLFKSEYGPGKLEYPLYEGSPVERFDTLLLRAGYNRSWAHYSHAQRNRAQYLRERFGSDTQREMGWTSPYNRHVHLFLNGLYWGIYLIQERPDASYMAQHFGGDKTEYDAVNAGEVTDGDLLAWLDTLAAADRDLSVPMNYDEMVRWLDPDQFIDYMLMNFYVGNFDWPDRNWRACRHRSDGSSWSFFNWDTELIMGNRADDRPLSYDFLVDPFDASPGYIYRKLMDNPEFRLRFADRLHLHMFNDGALTEERNLERWLAASDSVEFAMTAESARWGDHWRDVRLDPEAELYTYGEHWLNEKDRLVGDWFISRHELVIPILAAEGLVPSVDPPTFDPHGGMSDSVTMTVPQGDIYFRSDGGDPRDPGGAVAAAAELYTGPVQISGATTLKARTYDSNSGEWSAMTRADFN